MVHITHTKKIFKLKNANQNKQEKNNNNTGLSVVI